MSGAYLVFGMAVLIAVAWVVGVASFIEPEWQRENASQKKINPEPDATGTKRRITTVVDVETAHAH